MRGELEILLAGLIVIVLCAGCSILPSTEVRVPVPMACVDARPAPPHTFAAAELKAMDDYHLALALHYNALQLELYAAALEAALAGCWTPDRSGGT